MSFIYAGKCILKNLNFVVTKELVVFPCICKNAIILQIQIFLQQTKEKQVLSMVNVYKKMVTNTLYLVFVHMYEKFTRGLFSWVIFFIYKKKYIYILHSQMRTP